MILAQVEHTRSPFLLQFRLYFQMTFLLNYGQFYERIRDLLQNNHPVTKYKFGNKVNGAMRDFDNFLDNTVKKYTDAFNAIQFVKAENVQLRVIIDKLKKQIRQSSCEEEFLRLQLEEKDAICQQVTQQKLKLNQLFQYTIKDNPLLVQVQRLKFEVAELKDEKNEVRRKFELEKTRAENRQKQMTEQCKKLQEQLHKSVVKYENLQKEVEQKLVLAQKSMALKLSSQRKASQEVNKRQQSLWRREMQALNLKKQLWKKKYYDQVGFIALTQDNEDNPIND